MYGPVSALVLAARDRDGRICHEGRQHAAELVQLGNKAAVQGDVVAAGADAVAEIDAKGNGLLCTV